MSQQTNSELVMFWRLQEIDVYLDDKQCPTYEYKISWLIHKLSSHSTGVTKLILYRFSKTELSAPHLVLAKTFKIFMTLKQLPFNFLRWGIKGNLLSKVIPRNCVYLTTLIGSPSKNNSGSICNERNWQNVYKEFWFSRTWSHSLQTRTASY